LSARLWLHEIDHLFGELYIDKMTPLGKLAARQALKDLEREYRLAQKRGEVPSNDDIAKHLAEYGTTVPTGPVL
jgi:hypothetical protein